MTERYQTFSEEETQSVAGQFAGRLKRGDVVGLTGDLGAGKTQFVKGICSALEVHGHVTSPTFVRLHRYYGRDRGGSELLVHHLDLYRIGSTEEILDLGYEEIFYSDGICIVEWADRMERLLPSRRYDVHIVLGQKEFEREIVIRDTGFSSESA